MVESMDSEHKHMLTGGSVSNFFLRDSLTLCHPIFVGGLYGLMISIALLPPMAYGSLSIGCLLYTSPSPRDRQKSRMPSSA